MTSDLSDIEIQRKRLIYRAAHRGMKEMDIVLGPFAMHHLARFDVGDLQRFERLLDEMDTDLLAWITGQAPIPDTADRDMIERVIAFQKGAVAK